MRCIARLTARSIDRYISYAFTLYDWSRDLFCSALFVLLAATGWTNRKSRDDRLDVRSNTDRATKNQARTRDLWCIARCVVRSNSPVYTVRSNRFRSIGDQSRDASHAMQQRVKCFIITVTCLYFFRKLLLCPNSWSYKTQYLLTTTIASPLRYWQIHTTFSERFSINLNSVNIPQTIYSIMK